MFVRISPVGSSLPFSFSQTHRRRTASVLPGFCPRRSSFRRAPAPAVSLQHEWPLRQRIPPALMLMWAHYGDKYLIIEGNLIPAAAAACPGEEPSSL